MRKDSNSFTGSKNMHLVVELEGKSLFLGDYYAASNIDALKNKQIKAVLTTAAGLPLNYEGTGIRHKVFNALDIPSYNLGKHFAEAFDWLDEQLKVGNVLVHCAAGISRSATIVISYLMKKRGWEFKRTLAFVKSKRAIVYPNPGFLRQLENYEKALIKSLKESIITEKPKSVVEATKQGIKTIENIKQTVRDTLTKEESRPKKVSQRMMSSLRQETKTKKTHERGNSIPVWKKFSQQTVQPRIVTIRR